MEKLEKFHHPQLEEGSGIPKIQWGNLKYCHLQAQAHNVTSTSDQKNPL
jgi:hypothetical protein